MYAVKPLLLHTIDACMLHQVFVSELLIVVGISLDHTFAHSILAPDSSTVSVAGVKVPAACSMGVHAPLSRLCELLHEQTAFLVFYRLCMTLQVASALQLRRTLHTEMSLPTTLGTGMVEVVFMISLLPRCLACLTIHSSDFDVVACRAMMWCCHYSPSHLLNSYRHG